MSDILTSARTARERLSLGLGALQSPGVPEHLMEVAAPVAQAMGALHRIEATGGAALPEAAPAALESVRAALEQLQAQPIAHPAVDAAIESVAGSLGLVHGLVQSLQVAVPMPAEVRAAPMADREHGTKPSLGVPAIAPDAPAFVSAGGFPQSAAGYPQAPGLIHAVQTGPADLGTTLPSQSNGQLGHGVTAPGATGGYGQPMMAPGMMVSPMAPAMQPPPMAPAMQPPPMAPAMQPPPMAPAMQSPPMAPAMQAPPSLANAAHASTGLHHIDVALGVHSPSNFYKGLGGNDVVESGGVFVSTYQILPNGTPVAMKLSLPGGYEFEAVGVVRWVRDTASSAGNPPGLGVAFTEIAPENRQLVHRYVRNREPLFHDDL